MLLNIPEELRQLRQWVVWRYIERDGKQTKVPFTTTGRQASPTDPSTWTSFEEASNTPGYEGVGFVLSKDDPYTIIDLDNKPEKPCTPEQLARHQKIYEAFNSYTELSTSGTGVHIIVRGIIPAGMHRDNVEVYSDSRYMVCTGNVLRPMPIMDYQELLSMLYMEMQPVVKVILEDKESLLDDQQVVEMAMRAANADKFNALCAGDQTGYESQSEADFALLSILAFYTPDNEQVRRIFRMTALGKRTKATRNNTYLDFALGKIRAQQPAPVDLSQLAANAAVMMAPKVEATPTEVVSHEPISNAPQALPGIPLPPGIIGELAQYFYQTAIRPVPEIALAAAIALVAGVSGRAFNISGSGLNQYIILLARTGSGKEGALSGIENLISAIRPRVPMIDQFIGPAAFASGQALIKVLNENPCFVSVLGEFGLTLQQLSDSRANSAQLMLRKVLLDLYAKSGWNRMLRSSVYSDAEKNTKIIQAPNVTILGESTPETFFDGLDASHIAEGLIPRFSVIEYLGDRPPRNRNANVPPSQELAQKFADLVTVSLTTSNSNSCVQVELDSHSVELLDDFDTKADAIMNGSKLDVEMQLWNRAHLKALKLSALLAVGVNPYQPVVTREMAQWAIDFVVREVGVVVARFKDGDVGKGDSKQFHDLKRAIETYYDGKSTATKKDGRFHGLAKAKIIPYAYILQRTASVASFRNDKSGATNATRRTIQSMIDSGMLVEISKQSLIEKYGFSGVAYGIGAHWG